MSVSPSLSNPSEHSGGTESLSSSSIGLSQPGSSGKSIKPSPSLSIPSLHWNVPSFVSLSSFTLVQPTSAGKSMNPSPSLSEPSLHSTLKVHETEQTAPFPLFTPLSHCSPDSTT